MPRSEINLQLLSFHASGKAKNIKFIDAKLIGRQGQQGGGDREYQKES